MLLNPGVVAHRWRSSGRTANVPSVAAHKIVPRGEKTWLELVAVSQQHLRQGVGKALLEQVEARTRTLGFRAIGLRVDMNNDAARSLYEHSGYRLTRGSASGLNYEKVLYQR
jgi:GNAT superfamily N-acetyltransferase